MRFLNSLRIGVGIALAGTLTAFAQLSAIDPVAGSWHFAGASHLADDTNFAIAKSVLTAKSGVEFKDLVLTRFSVWVADGLGFNTNNATLLRPLLDDVLNSESYFVMGGKASSPLNFILAVQLDDARAKVWQANLHQALGPGKVKGLGSESWALVGGKSLWVDTGSHHWLLIGSGGELSAQRDQYLDSINKKGFPVPPLKQNWLEASIDWPRLAAWLPAPPFGLKPASTEIAMTTKGGSLRMKTTLTYPNPIPWKFAPWKIPTNFVSNPLISFTAAQDVAAVMTDDEPLSKLNDNPLGGEFFVWAMGYQGMPFQSYAAWPAADPTNTLLRLGTEAPAAFNPGLAQRRGGELVWNPKAGSLIWEKLASFIAPSLQATSPTNGSFLLASMFPLGGTNMPPPAGLFDQFIHETNLVYYDWELTTLRLQHWRLLSAMLPIIPPPAASSSGEPDFHPTAVNEKWLGSLTNLDNTVTEATRTGPTEVTVLRKSPLLFNSLELVMLSHWLTGTGSPGVNPGLLPQRAKVSGPGIPPDSH